MCRANSGIDVWGCTGSKMADDLFGSGIRHPGDLIAAMPSTVDQDGIACPEHRYSLLLSRIRISGGRSDENAAVTAGPTSHIKFSEMPWQPSDDASAGKFGVPSSAA